jgi:hypothetical protein
MPSKEHQEPLLPTYQQHIPLDSDRFFQDLERAKLEIQQERDERLTLYIETITQEAVNWIKRSNQKSIFSDDKGFCLGNRDLVICSVAALAFAGFLLGLTYIVLHA